MKWQTLKISIEKTITPQYSTPTEQSKPVATPRRTESIATTDIDFNSAKNWMMAAGGIALISWGGFSLFTKKESPVTQQVNQFNSAQNAIETSSENEAESIRLKLLGLTEKIDELQSQIEITTNQDRKNMLILKSRDLIIKHQDMFEALSHDDRQYIKTKPH